MKKLTAFMELDPLLISQRFWRKTKIAAIKVRDATIPLQAILQTRERSEFRAIKRTGSGIVTLELFASAAAIQPSAAALEAGLMEQEQHCPCSAVLP